MILISSNNDMPAIINALKSVNAGWLWMCLALSFAYLAIRSITLLYVLRIQDARIGLIDLMIVTGIGQFYSAITPSSSGGQPMQIIALHRMGVPVPSATAAISMKYIGFQAAFVLLGVISWVLFPGIVNKQLMGFRWLLVIGFMVNALVGVLLMLVSVNVGLVESIVRWGVRIAGKLRLVKDADAAIDKSMKYIYDYREAVSNLKKRPFSAFIIMIMSCLQVLAFASVVACLYKAFGLSGYNYQEITTLQLLLFLTASFMPLPGAAGAQEGGFFMFYKGVFPEGSIIAAMLCWRLFTYYFLMLWGLACVILEKIRLMCRDRRSERHGGG